MFDHLLEMSHRDDSNKWLNVALGEEITQVVLIEVNLSYFWLWFYAAGDACFRRC